MSAESSVPNRGTYAAGPAPEIAVAGASPSPCRVLCDIAPRVVPVLWEIGERTWPRHMEMQQKKFHFFGPVETVKYELPQRYKIILRRRDFTTLREDWRLEAAGPVGFFDWDDSGRILGPYGVRSHVYTVRPVYDELGHFSGFCLNGRGPREEDGRVRALDARLECQSYVRSTAVSDLIRALWEVQGKPRVEESRPGLDPTDAYFDLLERVNKATYFETRGTNQYIGPSFRPEALEKVFEDPKVRAVWLGDTEVPPPAEE